MCKKNKEKKKGGILFLKMEKLDLRYKGQSLALPEGSVGLETTVTELRAAVAKVAGLDARTVRLLGLRKGRGKGAPGQACVEHDIELCTYGILQS